MATQATALTTGTVVGYFAEDESAHSAFHALEQAGFPASQIGVASRGASVGRTGTTREDAGRSSSEPSAWDKVKNFFSAGNEAEPYAGEATGDSLDDHEITPTEYGGSEFRHSLAGLSVPEEHSRYFGHRFGQGDQATVVTVTAPNRADEARTILTQYGADLGEDAAEYDYSDNSTSLDASTTGEQNIRLYGEVLRVHKDRISSGEVRLRKEVITETQTVEVPVSREELVIERVAATGNEPATGASFTGEEIRIPLTEEVASLDKHAVLREEVRVGKRDVSDVETLNEEVRREELKVDDTTASRNEYAKR